MLCTYGVKYGVEGKKEEGKRLSKREGMTFSKVGGKYNKK